jgi:hypothetical protein
MPSPQLPLRFEEITAGAGPSPLVEAGERHQRAQADLLRIWESDIFIHPLFSCRSSQELVLMYPETFEVDHQTR